MNSIEREISYIVIRVVLIKVPHLICLSQVQQAVSPQLLFQWLASRVHLPFLSDGREVLRDAFLFGARIGYSDVAAPLASEPAEFIQVGISAVEAIIEKQFSALPVLLHSVKKFVVFFPRFAVTLQQVSELVLSDVRHWQELLGVGLHHGLVEEKLPLTDNFPALRVPLFLFSSPFSSSSAVVGEEEAGSRVAFHEEGVSPSEMAGSDHGSELSGEGGVCLSQQLKNWDDLKDVCFVGHGEFSMQMRRQSFVHEFLYFSLFLPGIGLISDVFPQRFRDVFLQVKLLLEASNSAEIGLHAGRAATVVIDNLEDSIGEEDEKNDGAHNGHVTEEHLCRITGCSNSIAHRSGSLQCPEERIGVPDFPGEGGVEINQIEAGRAVEPQKPLLIVEPSLHVVVVVDGEIQTGVDIGHEDDEADPLHELVERLAEGRPFQPVADLHVHVDQRGILEVEQQFQVDHVLGDHHEDHQDEQGEAVHQRLPTQIMPGYFRVFLYKTPLQFEGHAGTHQQQVDAEEVDHQQLHAEGDLVLKLVVVGLARHEDHDGDLQEVVEDSQENQQIPPQQPPRLRTDHRQVLVHQSPVPPQPLLAPTAGRPAPDPLPRGRPETLREEVALWDGVVGEEGDFYFRGEFQQVRSHAAATTSMSIIQ